MPSEARHFWIFSFQAYLQAPLSFQGFRGLLNRLIFTRAWCFWDWRVLNPLYKVSSFEDPAPPTHRAGKELELILAQSCSVDTNTVPPLHPTLYSMWGSLAHPVLPHPWFPSITVSHSPVLPGLLDSVHFQHLLLSRCEVPPILLYPEIIPEEFVSSIYQACSICPATQMWCTWRPWELPLSPGLLLFQHHSYKDKTEFRLTATPVWGLQMENSLVA